ncbi:MAG: GNAT family N-acetyltransferase [Firmicutes bacterium]|nr:GNAT family N-acetyltransferase [Bacillota bacterium]
MFLKEENLVIRNATEEDAHILCSWWNDGKVMAHAGFPNGLGTTPEAIAQGLANDSDETQRRLILEFDSMPVGEMSYRNIGNRAAEIGIKICNPSKQNRGFGTRFLKMLLASLLDEMGYEKIILDTNVNNTRAQHVYEKLGFKQVGVRVNAWKNQLGELQSSIDYELTREEFYKGEGKL